MNKQIYHMTDIDNLQSIIASGWLLSKNNLGKIKYNDISIPDVQDKRAKRIVPISPAGNLHDYVPFYFSTHTPMLYKLYKSGIQEKIIFLVSDTNRISQANVPYVFTDRHAVIAYAKFYNQISALHELDWNAINERNWGFVSSSAHNKEKKETELLDIKEKKHAEFLIHQRTKLELFLGIAVLNDNQINVIQTMINTLDQKPEVKVKKEWYFS